MPTELPSGLLIFNATPHSLNFHNRTWSPDVVVVPTDQTINAFSRSEVVYQKRGVFYQTLNFEPRDDALGVIERIRKSWPDVVIVGSILAAQAYPEEVVAPIFWYRGREDKNKLVRPDRFTVFKKEEDSHG